MLTQSHALEQRDRVGREDFSRALAGVDREQDRNQSARDMGIAVARERQHRTIPSVRASQTWLAQPWLRSRWHTVFGRQPPCRFRKLDSGVSMMEPAKDRTGDNVPAPLDRAREGRLETATPVWLPAGAVEAAA